MAGWPADGSSASRPAVAEPRRLRPNRHSSADLRAPRLCPCCMEAGVCLARHRAGLDSGADAPPPRCPRSAPPRLCPAPESRPRRPPRSARDRARARPRLDGRGLRALPRPPLGESTAPSELTEVAGGVAHEPARPAQQAAPRRVDEAPAVDRPGEVRGVDAAPVRPLPRRSRPGRPPPDAPRGRPAIAIHGDPFAPRFDRERYEVGRQRGCPSRRRPGTGEDAPVPRPWRHGHGVRSSRSALVKPSAGSSGLGGSKPLG